MVDKGISGQTPLITYTHTPTGGVMAPICEGAGTSCGINAYVRDGCIVRVEGNPDFPHSDCTLCSKGSASRQYVYNKERLLTPLKRAGPKGSGEFTPISWDEAYDEITDRLLGIKAQYGPESVLFGVGYTKWLRPFAQRLGLSFGSPNFATESSTCFYATVLASLLTYGSWFGGPDIANTDCLLLWTANPLHTATPAAKRLLGLKERSVKLIEVNPMVTPLTRNADYYLALRPGTADKARHVVKAEGLPRQPRIDKQKRDVFA